MALVVILAMVWLVLLAPGALKRWFGGGADSITHFHRQLRVLEHSGAEPLVRPAYRLRSSPGEHASPGAPNPRVAGSPAPVLTVVGADQLPRPALAFLGDGPGAEDGAEGGPLRDAHRTATASAAAVPSNRTPDPWARQVARQRRRTTLSVLLLAFTFTLLVGCIPGAHLLWVLTALSGVATAAYVALLVHLRTLADERDRKLRYLYPGEPPVPVAPAVTRHEHPAGRAVAAR